MKQIKLPWPPTINTYWRSINGRNILSKKGREYSKIKFDCPKFDGKIRLCIEAYPPDRRRRDLDNILKPLLDLLTKNSVFDDDSQVDDLRVIRKEVEKPGYVIVRIETIS